MCGLFFLSDASLACWAGCLALGPKSGYNKVYLSPESAGYQTLGCGVKTPSPCFFATFQGLYLSLVTLCQDVIDSIPPFRAIAARLSNSMLCHFYLFIFDNRLSMETLQEPLPKYPLSLISLRELCVLITIYSRHPDLPNFTWPRIAVTWPSPFFMSYTFHWSNVYNELTNRLKRRNIFDVIRYTLTIS